MEITINILISVLTGVIAGIYSGIAVARMSKFEEIRNQIKRIILNIDFMYSSEQPKILPKKDVSELLFLSSDFYALKHACAGENTSKLLAEVNNVINVPPQEFEVMNKTYSEWQETCRNLKPNFRVIFSLKPWV
ncbi:MAG: hypothetical protein KJ725_14320 [Gammaproteobacteria bacterium]|nr:hypothetical protein [Gammaproteobacteria bacterium]